MGDTVRGVPSLADYPHFLTIPTRWNDNDVYGHVNNVEYYSFFDTVINRWLITRGRARHPRGRGDRGLRGVALQLQGRVRVPRDVEAGLRVGKLGRSSVRYEIGLFARGADEPSATGWFVHVFVEPRHRRPAAIPERLRRSLERAERSGRPA